MARTCDACKELIRTETFLELAVRVLDPTKNEDQQEHEQQYGDYCNACIINGRALADVLTGLKKHDLAGHLPKKKSKRR